MEGLGDGDGRPLPGPAATGGLGEADADESEVAGRAVEGARQLTDALPLVLVGQDLAVHELGRRRP